MLEINTFRVFQCFHSSDVQEYWVRQKVELFSVIVLMLFAETWIPGHKP
jgi:hypothetical protein